MPSIELVDTFADASLEMDETGNKFRVAQELQDAIAGQASPPLVSVPFVAGFIDITPGHVYFAKSGNVIGNLSILTIEAGLDHDVIHGQRIGIYSIGGHTTPNATLQVSGDGERIQNPRNLTGPSVTQVTPLPYVGYSEWVFDKNGDAGGLWRVAMWLDGPTIAGGLLETGQHAALDVGAIPWGAVLRRSSGGQTIVGGPLMVDDAGNVTGAAKINGITPFPLATTAPVDVKVQAAAAGVAPEAAPRDHAHSVLIGPPVALVVGGSNVQGSAVALAPANHQHGLPAFGSAAGTFCQGNDARLSDARIPTAHKVSHQDGGVDEINVVGLSGLLADPQTPLAHKVSHQDGGVDELVVTGLSGELADPQKPKTHAASHATGGSDPISLATTVVDGLMPATSASKLAGIAAGADVTLTALSVAATDIAVNSKKITGLANPTNAQDACTKAYADAVTQGLDVKQSCRVIATANIALTGTQTIDGVAVVVGDRVLCAGQTTGAANGIYVVAAGAWARATDADLSAEVTSGLFVFVVEGTANADSGWVLTTLDPIVLGTTSLVFAQFSGAGQIQAGAGLTKTGNTLNVAANADGSIVVAADDVKVGILATDAQHGTRGGGTVHAAVTTTVNGFMIAADKVKLDGLAVTHAARHADGGADELSVAGLSGKLADAQTALAHAGSHAVGSADGLAVDDPVALIPGVGFAQGGSSAFARADHRHAIPAFGSAAGTFCEGNDARLTSLVNPAINGFRLAPTADDSIPADGTFSTIYMAPVEGDLIALFDGSAWFPRRPTGAVSYTLAGRTADLPFDVFASWNGSTVVLSVLNWASTTARATAISRVNGVWLRQDSVLHRYLGTVRPRSATTYGVRRKADFYSGPAAIDYWNVTNRRTANLMLQVAAGDYIYTTNTYRMAGGGVVARIDTIAGIGGDSILGNIQTGLACSDTNPAAKAVIAFGLNGTTPVGSRVAISVFSSLGRVPMYVSMAEQIPLGIFSYWWLEHGTGVGTCTWDGSADGTNHPGMSALIGY